LQNTFKQFEAFRDLCGTEVRGIIDDKKIRSKKSVEESQTLKMSGH